MSVDVLESQYQRAAETVRAAGALLVTAGAGMGVDSGMPDFRGPEGFWRAYPAYRDLGLRFEEMANPRWFVKDPELAWGFYGHRMALYRRTEPHAGFGVLRRWGERAAHGAFVFTSNVDCHFQRSGFLPERIVECHGTLEYFQCLNDCGGGLFPSRGVHVDVDPKTFRARGKLPACPSCGGLARPNVLMFGDAGWDSSHSEQQDARWHAWLMEVQRAGAKLVIVELGAGTGVPTVRRTSERLAAVRGATLIRINVREPQVPEGHIGVAQGALAALRAVDRHVSRS